MTSSHTSTMLPLHLKYASTPLPERNPLNHKYSHFMNYLKRWGMFEMEIDSKSCGISFNTDRIVQQTLKQLLLQLLILCVCVIIRIRLKSHLCSAQTVSKDTLTLTLRYTHWMNKAEFSSKFWSSWTEWITESHPENQENILLFCARHLWGVLTLRWKSAFRKKQLLGNINKEFNNLLFIKQSKSIIESSLWPQMSVTYCGSGLIDMHNTTFPLCLQSQLYTGKQLWY